MKWDPVRIKQGKKDRAKTELKEALRAAMEAGLFYEDICEIVATTVNEVADEMRVVAEEAM